MELQLLGKRALVSGSTAGIGFAIVRVLAKEGVNVILNGRTQKAVDEAIAKLKSENIVNVDGFAGDFGTQKAVDDVVKLFPDVDILINNLGIYEVKSFEDIPDEDWHRFFDVNVLSGVRLSRAYLPRMKTKNWGRIIFISSESAIQIPAEMIHYGMTKTAQLAISRGLAETLLGTNITVNCVLPGATKSRGLMDFVDQLTKETGQTFEEFEKEFFEKVRPTQLLKRFTSPDEVAAMVAYIASPLSSATTGAALRVDGGTVKSVC